MNSTEIKTAATSLDKARSANDTKTIINILSELESISATESLLRETKIGVHVNKLKSYDDESVTNQVKKIIKKWKDQVSLEKRSSKLKKEIKKDEISTSSKSSAETTTTDAVTVNQVSPPTSKGPRTPKTDGIKVEPYAESTRNSSVAALYVALGVNTPVASSTILDVSTKIEDCIYKAHDSSINNNYRTKLRSLILNLKNKNNDSLRNSVLNGDISPLKLSTMTSQELAPEALKQQLQSMHEKNLFDAQGAVEKRAVTDRFVCGKCKQREVSYYQMQTRSADEPLTTFCTCEKCGNRWKFC